MTFEEIKLLWPAEKRNNLIRRLFNLLRKNNKVDLQLQSSYWGQNGNAGEFWLVITFKNRDTGEFKKKTFNASMLLDEYWNGLDEACGADKVPLLENKIILRLSYLLWRQEHDTGRN